MCKFCIQKQLLMFQVKIRRAAGAAIMECQHMVAACEATNTVEPPIIQGMNYTRPIPALTTNTILILIIGKHKLHFTMYTMHTD